MKGEEERLRYLQFVHAAAAHMIVCAAALYAYAKESAGPLKPGVETVEGTVKTVVGPVYDRFHYAPLHLLKFLDRKVNSLLLFDFCETEEIDMMHEEEDMANNLRKGQILLILYVIYPVLLVL